MTTVKPPPVPVLVGDTPEGDYWEMPRKEYVVATALLCSELFLAIVTNIALIVTIWHSPSLKTPPNAYLVNICVNNLLLAVSMILSFALLLVTGSEPDSTGANILGGVQHFLCTLCLLQYWSIFSAIGYYRSRTIKKPTMTLKVRRTTIFRSIVVGWTVSLLLAVGLTAVHAQAKSSMSYVSFRRTVNQTEVTMLTGPEGGQSAMLALTLVAVFVCLGIIINSYYWILRELHVTTLTVQNRVSPWTRSSSVSSDDNELIVQKRSYKPEEEHASRPPFVISNGHVSDAGMVVHFDKRSQSISFQEEAVALEHPIRAHSSYQTHRKLEGTLSTASQGSPNRQQLGVTPFTDISPGAELQRFQRLKNHCALRNQSWRKDRTSLSGATKNSLVMLATFLVCSLPLVITSIPTVLATDNLHNFNTTLLFCTLVFYLNSPAYPAWYLIGSKRVRKCLARLFENTLIKLNIRQ